MRIQTILLIACLSFTTATTASAQVSEDRGAMGLSQALKRLDVVSSVLHTGAHPDDENSALLAWLSRGQGVRTAYLSATRGDGGQNLLGTELFEALGVIRSEELLGARRFDHAQQFFTPNYEFGFSKTADESLEKWGREQVLGDFVRVIRYFRPEIIVSRFTGTTRDGHGHHQVAGLITPEAFKAAADPNRFPEYGKPWQAKKLYLNFANEQNGVTLNVGEFDSALGRSYSEIAAEGRSLHRSQAQGSAQERGPRQIQVQLVQKTVDVPDNADLFSGVVHKLSDLAQLDAGIAADVNQLQQRVTVIRQKANLVRPADLVPDLTAALKQLQQVRARSANEQVRFLLDGKESDFQEALRLAAGLVLDVQVSDDTVIPGQDITLTVSVVNGGPYDFSTLRALPALPPGWEAVLDTSTGTLHPGQRMDQKFKVKVSAAAKFSQPYWLQQPRRGDRFVWPEGAAAMLPFDPPLLTTRTELDYDGMSIVMSQPASFRSVDSMYGEQRSLLKTVPVLSVRIAPEIAIVPLAGSRQKELTVSVENQSPTALESEVRLITPAGWTVSPASKSVKFTRPGEKAAVQFMVTVPATAGDFTVQAVARTGSQEFRNGYATVAYPHMETQHIYSPAESKIEVFDVKTRVTSVGYVEGAGDLIPEALRELGIGVTRLSAQDLATGDLSRFPTIVMGVRAYGVRDDLRAYSNRILEYVANGGTVIAQYNRRGETRDIQIGPYPFTIDDAGRVTKEEAAVRMVDPSRPVLNVPNKITEADFANWVQERGNYFLSAWDPQYAPLLESADPGEAPQQGGMVIAKHGKGSFVYSGYGFFRQLPAGVKGAYRLFANLVSIEN